MSAAKESTLQYSVHDQAVGKEIQPTFLADRYVSFVQVKSYEVYEEPDGCFVEEFQPCIKSNDDSIQVIRQKVYLDE